MIAIIGPIQYSNKDSRGRKGLVSPDSSIQILTDFLCAGLGVTAQRRRGRLVAQDLPPPTLTTFPNPFKRPPL